VHAFEKECGVNIGPKSKSPSNKDYVESDDTMVMKFKHPNTYESNEHINILAMPKTEY